MVLKLDIGGEVAGPVLDHTDDMIVLDYRHQPCAFAFGEMTFSSASQAKRQLLAAGRGGDDRLTAEDHLDLGLYALSRDEPVAANREFRQAVRIDADYKPKVQEAQKAYRERRKAGRDRDRDHDDADSTKDDSPDAPAVLPGLSDTVNQLADADRDKINAAYKQFGQSVREDINPDLELVETEHFLIWTDWRRSRRDELAAWCEDMYAALAKQFGVAEDQPIFLAKCPVFCFRSKARYLRFARTYDGWEPRNAVGYTRTDSSGHVHVVIYRRRDTPYEVDRFAGTLVHEGVHAFLHRYYKTMNIRGWVGEGLANYIAQQVLGDRCLYGQQADLVARQYVLQKLPIDALLAAPGMPEAHEYPVVQSLIQFLINRDPAAFAPFIQNIKDGQPPEQALRRSFNGLDYGRLEALWQEWVLAE